MRLSVIRTGVAALAAAIALAACGGSHGIVPSSGLVPGMGADHPHTSPCASTKLPWYFKGACVMSTLKSGGGTTKLPAYKGLTASVTIGANTAKGTVAFIVGDATGNGDIAPSATKKPFPLCTSKACGGTSVVYLEAVNGSSATINITGSSTLVIGAPKFPGKSCFPAVLGTKGWTAYAVLTGIPKNGKVTFTIPPVGLFKLPAGALYIAIVCK